jgi:predicted phage terminase large subunit-like protein
MSFRKKAMLTDRDLFLLYREDFASFIQLCFANVTPGAQYLHNWHIDLIASRLVACQKGQIRRLIINLPPRNLKSIIASVAFPAWLLGHQPKSEIICASYGQELAQKHALDTRQIMRSDWYLQLFGSRIGQVKNAVDEFITPQGGGRIATSVGGPLTGRGGNFIIIDDPLKPMEAISDSQRQQVNQWYDGTLYSRLNDKQEGCIIIIMQRLHEDDLVGHVLRQEKWEVISLPAIAETTEVFEYHSLMGKHRKIRKPGEILHPEREPKEVLDTMQSILGEYHFAGQYQQQPAPLGGGIIRSDWFRRYDHLPERFDAIVQSWDTASKASELTDYSVCTSWGIKGSQYYLLDIVREKLEYPELRRKAISHAARWRATTVLIEDKASGTQLFQDLRQDLGFVQAIRPEGEKTMRILSQTGVIENGAVYLPRDASWLPVFLHEVTTFPCGRYDDQVDSLSQFLIWVRRWHRNSGPRIRSL